MKRKLLTTLIATVTALSMSLPVGALGLRDIFDAQYYASHNPDVAAAYGSNTNKLYSHYIKYGFKEGRSISPIFDLTVYRAQNADLQAAFGDNAAAYVDHYFKFGLKENRKTGATLDPIAYAAANPDVAKAYGNNYKKIAEHYLQYGFKEKRGGVKPVIIAVVAADKQGTVLSDQTKQQIIRGEIAVVRNAGSYGALTTEPIAVAMASKEALAAGDTTPTAAIAAVKKAAVAAISSNPATAVKAIAIISDAVINQAPGAASVATAAVKDVTTAAVATGKISASQAAAEIKAEAAGSAASALTEVAQAVTAPAGSAAGSGSSSSGASSSSSSGSSSGSSSSYVPGSGSGSGSGSGTDSGSGSGSGSGSETVTGDVTVTKVGVATLDTAAVDISDKLGVDISTLAAGVYYYHNDGKWYSADGTVSAINITDTELKKQLRFATQIVFKDGLQVYYDATKPAETSGEGIMHIDPSLYEGKDGTYVFKTESGAQKWYKVTEPTSLAPSTPSAITVATEVTDLGFEVVKDRRAEGAAELVAYDGTNESACFHLNVAENGLTSKQGGSSVGFEVKETAIADGIYVSDQLSGNSIVWKKSDGTTLSGTVQAQQVYYISNPSWIVISPKAAVCEDSDGKTGIAAPKDSNVTLSAGDKLTVKSGHTYTKSGSDGELRVVIGDGAMFLADGSLDTE